MKIQNKTLLKFTLDWLGRATRQIEQTMHDNDDHDDDEGNDTDCDGMI